MTGPDDSTLGKGTFLAHYRIETAVGAGAMGTVYRAWDTSLERPVAVKVLHARVAEDPEVVRRFEREARAAARVNHPNLTHVYFVGRSDERRFFVMEFVPGDSLLDHVAAHGPVALERAVDILTQAARGLAAAHAGGVIHRDVKPSNLMLLPDGSVKVTDFGLAKSLQGDADATGAGRVMGTPRYMSPEQCRGEVATPATDTYSLGLVGFYLLAGHHPYDGESLGKVLNDQMNAPLPRLSAIRSDLPPAAESVFDRLCEKDATKRPQTMDDVRALLDSIRPRRLDLAPLATRAAAFVGDFLALAVPLLALKSVFRIFGADDPAATGGLTEIAYELPAAVMVTALAVWAEWRFGGLPGKLAFGVRVMHETGARPSIAALVARFFLRAPIIASDALEPLLGAVLGHSVIPEIVSGVAWGVQLLAVVSGAVCYFVLSQRTLSDVLTGTRVVLHRATESTDSPRPPDRSERGATPSGAPAVTA